MSTANLDRPLVTYNKKKEKENIYIDIVIIVIIVANQDKFTLTKFSFHIDFHKELSISVLFFVRAYCLEVECSQTLQVQ